MIWFILEAGLALALLIFIVWWTMPRKTRRDERGMPVPGSSPGPALSEVEGSEVEKERLKLEDGRKPD